MSLLGTATWKFKSLMHRHARSPWADYLAALLLKCRRHLWHVCTRQVPAYVVLLEVDQSAQRLQAKYFLDAGTLLGAVRQGAFAGRPSDVDVMFSNRDEAVRVVEELAQTRHFSVFRELQDRIHLYYQPISRFRGRIGNPVLCDVSYGGDCLCLPDKALGVPDARMLTADVFDKAFPICPCYERRLKSLYGPEWKIPSVTQVAERKPRIRIYAD